MKIAARLLSLMILTSVVVMYTGCGKDDPAPKSDADQQIALLNGTWNATSVKFQGVDETADYADFALTIAGTEGQTSLDYTATGRPDEGSAWPGSGTFTFGSDVKQTLIRDQTSDTEVTITYSVTETTLIMDFEYLGDPISRSKNVAGAWQFTFEKQ